MSETPTTPGTESAASAGFGMAGLAGRLGWTEGQLYTMSIGLLLSVVLLGFGLPGTLGSRGLPAAAEEPAAAMTPVSPPTTSAAPPTTGASPSAAPLSPAPTTTQPSPTTTSATPVPPTPQLPPPRSPDGEASCPATVDAKPLLDLLDAVDLLPDQSIARLIARLGGCSETDPAVLILGALAETGASLPDLGIEIPPLQVPFLEIPGSLIDAVQPLRDAIDPLCDAVGDASRLLSLGLGAWPAGIGRTIATPIQQVLLVCGQLRT